MVNHFENQMQEFDQHVKRVNTRYNQIRNLKENLPAQNMILQMNFSESYSRKSLHEVQSAYFNQTGVTLHPAVAYYHDSEGNLKHSSTFSIDKSEFKHVRVRIPNSSFLTQ